MTHLQNIQEIDNKIKELQEKKEKLLAEKSKVRTIIIDGIEYEKETHDFNKKLSDIQIPKGWRLWTSEECIKLHNLYRKELNIEDCWFFIKQPFEFNKRKDYVARFLANSDGALLNCDGNPSSTYSNLGVRFCRKISRSKR